jgi:hypothetical protein
VSLSADELVFTGEGGGSRQYALDLRFYKPVDPHHQVRASWRVALCFDSRCRES